MIAGRPGRHQLAVGILAIATAAIGFGLFGSNLQIGQFGQIDNFASSIQNAKLAGIALTALFYFWLLLDVSRILLDDEITGSRLVFGPLQWLFMEMLSLAVLYGFTIIQELVGE